MAWSRKTMAPWVEQHMGRVVSQQDAKLCSGFVIEGPVRKTGLIVANKRGRVADYTRFRHRWESGINAGIWDSMERANGPIRLALCHKGEIYLHRAEDMRQWTPPEIRYVHGQDSYDAKGVAWWPWEDFRLVTGGLPGTPVLKLERQADPEPDPDAEPKAEPSPNILDLFGGKD